MCLFIAFILSKYKFPIFTIFFQKQITVEIINFYRCIKFYDPLLKPVTTFATITVQEPSLKRKLCLGVNPKSPRKSSLIFYYGYFSQASMRNLCLSCNLCNWKFNTNEIIKFSLKRITFSEKEISIYLWESRIELLRLLQ